MKSPAVLSSGRMGNGQFQIWKLRMGEADVLHLEDVLEDERACRCGSKVMVVDKTLVVWC